MLFTQSLKKNHLFRRLYQRGKSAVGRYTVVYCRRNGLSCNRLGITASTKIGNAVVRNRVRRRIREAYRLSESSYRRGFDIVVVARSRAAGATFREISDGMFRQAEKLGLIRKELTHEENSSPADSVLPD